MMTFDEAEELLKKGDGLSVVEEMETWHPATLGAMLTAVAISASRSFTPRHKDYEEGMNDVVQFYGADLYHAKQRGIMR